ncbi:NAD(P)-dependent oxidoreductase [Demequina sp. NBRC 110056]|uniref:NAD(P)-dependent oxidoreductase n=1 Tax=Demequina sp. NBRC 110056 TaxID=1570345 RepID=UPI000A02BB9F|nr:NAD(P)H-binding protein [Demequina sp. NBRC 110056]
MRVAVLGATGRTGSRLTTLALGAQHDVVAYARRPDAITPQPGLAVVGGELDDLDGMTSALSGCDAVVVALGPKVSQAHAPIMQTAMPTVIAAARAAGVRRIVVLSALGVGETFANTRYPYRFGCRTFLAGNFRDHLAGESLLEDSGLEWTTLHPGPLGDGAATPKPTIIEATPDYAMPRAPRTQRSDVAAAMLRMLDDPTTYGKRMLITSARQMP